MIEQTWLLNALSIGIAFKDFWLMTPHEVLLCIDGYKAEKERQMEYDNTMAFLQGRYFVDALLSTVGNMFSKKGAKQMNYPKEPYPLKEKVYTEEELQEQGMAIIANLQQMQENFERAKNKGKE